MSSHKDKEKADNTVSVAFLSAHLSHLPAQKKRPITAASFLGWVHYLGYSLKGNQIERPHFSLQIFSETTKINQQNNRS